MLLVMGGYQLIEFMDSTAFCGRLCHDVMYPEYTAYQASTHSRVTCAECHVGSGADYLVKSKLSGIPLIITTVTGSYHRPIPTPVENLRPARDTCEQCHRPERFAGDLVRQHTTFATDEMNTSKIDIRVMRVGGGEAAETAKDIHWHIAASVWYLALDHERQDIVWVGVEEENGGLIEYVNQQKEDEFDAEKIESEKRLMDCMDCHNRATHIFYSPDELIDASLVQGKIDTGLPYIKREGLAALDPQNDSLEQAYDKVDAIEEFYSTNYPDVYKNNKKEIDDAITELKEIARLTTFPDMHVTWDTYIDNSSHEESPGCFRCHGRLVAVSGDNAGATIDIHCDSCHYFELQQ